jgi:hypothetical protein
MKVAGDFVRDDSRHLFTGGAARTASIQKTADNFETRVRAGGQSEAILVVGQKLRKTSGLHPEWGALQMTKAFLPAQARDMDEVTHILADGVGNLLRRHGF